MRIPSGAINQSVYFCALDPTDLHTRKTGLTGFIAYRSRNGAAPVAYTTATFAEVSSANMPGVYSLLIDEDTTIGASSDSEEYVVHITQTGGLMDPVTRSIELYRRTATAGRTATLDASGRVDLGAWLGGTPNALIAGRIDSWPIVQRSGTCQAGGSTTTVHLDAAASTVNDIYAGMLIVFTGGTGTGQQSNITAYDGASKFATIAPVSAAADATTTFVLVGLPGLVAAASTDVYNQVIQALVTDTYGEPGQGAPPATASIKDKQGYIYKFMRNRLTNDGITTKVYADNNTTVDHKAAVTEVSNLVSRDKFGAGP
jgi:hypothetical protein